MPTLVAYPYQTRTDFDLDDPTIASTGTAPATLVAAINDEGAPHWLDYEPVSGNVRTVFEFDLSGLPAGAIPTGVQLEFCLERGGGSTSGMKLRSCAIDGNGALVLGPDEQSIRGAAGAPTPYRMPMRNTLALGESWGNYGNICVQVTNDRGSDPSGTMGHLHRLWWVRAVVEYAGAPPTPVSPTLSGTIAVPNACGWTYVQQDGAPQTHYRVAISPGSGTVDADTFSGWVFDTGKTQGAATRSVSLAEDPLPNGAYRQWVKVWGRLSDGSIVESAWVNSSFTVTSAPDRPADLVSVTVDGWDTYRGGAAVLVETGEFWTPELLQVQRSVDGGVTWRRIDDTQRGWPGEAFWASFPGITSLYLLDGALIVRDFGVPLGVPVLYRVRRVAADAGAVSNWVTSEPATIAVADLIVTGADGRGNGWWLLVDGDQTLCFQPVIQAYQQTSMRRTVVAVGSGGNSVTQSPDLGRRIRLGIYAKDQAERLAIEGVLDSGRSFRLIDNLGRGPWLRLASEVEFDMWRAQPLPDETSGLRDMHVISFEVVEVREPGA